ncbi:MAG: hypothetical protein JWO36_3035 [Myxococcales bacterium]|nr:hypothetical protein [Myxococcales bacterium]
MPYRCLYVLALVGCQEKPKALPAPSVTTIEVRDGAGRVLASLRVGHPCRATVDRVELFVGGPPLVSQHGDERWTGNHGPDGTLLLRDGTTVARVFPTDQPGELAVFDKSGVALVSVVATKDAASVSSGGHLIRQLARKGDAISVDPPEFTISGTTDLILAAVLSAPELVPEVRGLVACERSIVPVPPVPASESKGST